MKLQIASDLHIEYFDNFNENINNLIIPQGDILILAGDIGSLYNIKQLESFFYYYCNKFTYILYVFGNCEFYKLNGYEPVDMDILKNKFKYIEKMFPNLFVLDRSSIQIGNYLFTGCTLWSDLKKNLPKNYKIHNFSSYKYKYNHKKDLDFIIKKSKYAIQKNLKHIIITHHLPILIDTKKEKTDLFMTDLSWIFDKFKINTWICGHVHQNFNIINNNTKIISNQKGKPGSYCLDYSKNYCIDI
jgi:Icc-related predicted phosphoesterase